MAIQMAALRKLIEDEGLQYFLDPHADAVLLSFDPLNGRIQITITIQLEGQFLQFLSMGYAKCPPDHPHLAAVLRALAEINSSLRLVKFAWEAKDGTIAGFADMWLMDAPLSAKQFERMLYNFVPSLDENLPRILRTIESGVDPGPEDPEALLARVVAETTRDQDPEVGEI